MVSNLNRKVGISTDIKTAKLSINRVYVFIVFPIPLFDVYKVEVYHLVRRCVA